MDFAYIEDYIDYSLHGNPHEAGPDLSDSDTSPANIHFHPDECSPPAAIPQTQQWEDVEPTATNTRFTIDSSEESQWELAKGEIQHFRNLQFRSYFLESNVMKMIRILVFI